MKHVINGLKFMFRSRGWAKGFRRATYILSRFGITARKHARCLRTFLALLHKHDVPATFFIPAVVLKRHVQVIRSLPNAHVEWGVHYFKHSDVSQRGRAQQRDELLRAIKIFQELEIPFRGFRAPYLKTNEDTLEVLSEAGVFLYDSSHSIVWDDIYSPGKNSYHWMEHFYKPKMHSVLKSYPQRINGIVEVPVSLPDDDMLVDRDRRNSADVHAVWQQILRKAYTHNELFVLQLHPERICELEHALDLLIAEAKGFDPPIWIASMSEVAAWRRESCKDRTWPKSYQGAFCISGDVDAVSLIDFADRLRTW